MFLLDPVERQCAIIPKACWCNSNVNEKTSAARASDKRVKTGKPPNNSANSLIFAIEGLRFVTRWQECFVCQTKVLLPKVDAQEGREAEK